MHSDAIETTDLTARAVAGGWTLPDGWTVKADISPDDGNSVPTDHGDCYTPAQVEAWRRDDWTFVLVSVWVEDGSGREWGSDVLGMTEYGSFVLTDEEDNVTGTEWLNPLDDRPGEYSVIREHDMINNAIDDAVKALESFGTPEVFRTTNYSGL